MALTWKHQRVIGIGGERDSLGGLRVWFAGSSTDPDASISAVLGCTYLVLINFLGVFSSAGQSLSLGNSARALIMLLVLALLPARRYLQSRLLHPRRWMFIVPAVLATIESARSIGSIYKTHAISSVIIACVAITFAIDFPDRVHRWTNGRRARWFFILVFLSFLLAHAAVTRDPFFAFPSIDAVKAMSRGLNPYKVELDATDLAYSNNGDARFKGYFAFGNTRVERFRGYKYSPLLPIIYFPGVMAMGGDGILISNGIVLVFASFLVSALCGRLFAGNGNWAAALLLATPLVGSFVLVGQANDLVAVLPICAAFLIRDKRSGLAGLLLGASASIKIMPAPIAMALLLPPGLQTARRFLVGIAAGLTPIVVFAALDPPAFFNNVVLFEIARPSSPTSLLFDMPSSAIWLLRSGFAVIFLAIAAAALIRHWSIDSRIVAYVVLIIVVLLFSQHDMDNYWLWWIPFYLPLLCAGPVMPANTVDMLDKDHLCFFASGSKTTSAMQ
jgi:hypothetical protein